MTQPAGEPAARKRPRHDIASRKFAQIAFGLYTVGIGSKRRSHCTVEVEFELDLLSSHMNLWNIMNLMFNNWFSAPDDELDGGQRCHIFDFFCVLWQILLQFLPFLVINSILGMPNRYLFTVYTKW